MLRRDPSATIVSYEPEPGNAAVVARTIESNDAHARWTLREAAAATADGTLAFAAGRGATSHVVEHGAGGDGVVTVAARDAFPDLERADVVKIDIEGGEWALLADPRFATLPARVICVEYHLRGAPSGDPGAEAERIVREAGWTVLHEQRDGMPGHGLVWGWRTAPADQLPVSASS
jgi:FkbM family methyltransferase